MRAINEMMVTAPNDGSFIHLLPYFPANESAAFTTLRTKGGWLVSANKAQATASELATGGRGVVSGVEIAATVAGTVQLVSPWVVPHPGAVACRPAPVSPAVRRVRVHGRAGLAWTMAAGQVCKILQD